MQEQFLPPVPTTRKYWLLAGIGLLIGLHFALMTALVASIASIAPEVKTTLDDVGVIMPEMRITLKDLGQMIPEIKTGMNILEQLCETDDTCRVR